MNRPIPHPADLDFNECIMTVQSYDEFEDTCMVHLQTSAPNEGQVAVLPALIMPALIGEFDDPFAWVGKTFLVKMPRFPK